MVQSSAETTLGTEFWVQPEAALIDIYNLIYANVLEVLKDEVRARNGSSVDYLIIERLAFMYAYLRQRESTEENALTDRTRREMNKDWLELATAMKKMWNSEDKDNAQEIVLKKVNQAIAEALKDLPESQGRQLQNTLASAFESNGI